MSLNIDLNLNDEDSDVNLDKDSIDGEENEMAEPGIGMVFVSLEDARSYYLKYAKSVGFGVSVKNSRRSRASGEFINAIFACTRYGKRQNSKATNPRPSYKIGCEAILHVRKKYGKWIVQNFVKEHNHELVPEYAHYFPCHRNISSLDMSTANDFHAVGVQTSTIYAAMAKQHRGYQNIGFIEKDLRNHFDKVRRLELAAADANAMLDLFMHMQEENPNFFYAVDLDEDQSLRNVFWVDAKGREDYKIFGDVVSFDTTYITNKYKMPFAPFIGVNNHFQSTLLGCALLADETTSTFVWLMQTWLRAMGGKPLGAILTDQDKAMKSAIVEVFPNSRHRFCLWHIFMKIPQKLGQVIKENEDFTEIFDKCIYNSWTSEEFEKGWWDMIDRFELHDNEWLASLFEDRSYWIHTYMRDTFFAGMSTTQSSESINSFFDKYLGKKTTLKEFVGQYNVALQDRQEQEAQADFRTWHTLPAFMAPSPFERKMSKVYTHEVFKKFQVEVLRAGECYPKELKEDNVTKTFEVGDFQKKYDFKVEWNARKKEIYCGCRLFEYNRFLCRHALAVFHSLGVFDIPSHYILERWTKNVKTIYSSTIKQSRKEVKYRKYRFDKLFREATKLSKEGSMSDESFDIAYLGLKETLKRCAVVNQSIKSSECQCRCDKDNTQQTRVLDPQVLKTKGAPKRSIKPGTNKCNKRHCNKSKEVRKNDEVTTNQVESSSQKMGHTKSSTRASVETHLVASTIGLPL